jgi:hypothetical protein
LVIYLPLKNDELQLVIERLGKEILKIDNEMIKSCDTNQKRKALIYMRYMLSDNLHQCEVELFNRNNNKETQGESRGR